MGPKIKFTKEQIIDAAFELAREQGPDKVTLRKVAERLGCSVAPIYVNFSDGNELMIEVANKAKGIAMEMSRFAYTDMPFLNIGIGTLKFAREYSTFYNDRSSAPEVRQDNGAMEQEMLQQMKGDPMLEGFSDEELMDMLIKMSIFTHGLASMAALKVFPPHYDEAMLIDLMKRTGEDIVMAARIKKEAEKHESDNCKWNSR